MKSRRISLTILLAFTTIKFASAQMHFVNGTIITTDSSKMTARIQVTEENLIISDGKIRYYNTETKYKKRSMSLDKIKNVIIDTITYQVFSSTNGYDVNSNSESILKIGFPIKKGKIDLLMTYYNDYYGGGGPGNPYPRIRVLSRVYLVTETKSSAITKMSFKSTMSKYYAGCDDFLQKIKNKEYIYLSIFEAVETGNKMCD